MNLPVEVQSEVTQSLALAEQARQFVVTTANDYIEAGGILCNLKATIKLIDAKREELKAPVLETGRRIDGWLKPPINEMTEAGKVLGAKMSAFDRARREEAARLQREADARKATEQARLNAEAEVAREAGKPLAAAVAEAKAANVESANVPTPVVKVAGLTFRDVWRARVVDESLVPREFLTVDPVKLGKFARDTKGQNPVAGIVFYAEQTSVGR
jgi:hypothetical protein